MLSVVWFLRQGYRACRGMQGSMQEDTWDVRVYVCVCVCVQAALTCARSLMAPSIDIRDSFEASQGPQLLMTLHQDYKDNTTLQVHTDTHTHTHTTCTN